MFSLSTPSNKKVSPIFFAYFFTFNFLQLSSHIPYHTITLRYVTLRYVHVYRFPPSAPPRQPRHTPAFIRAPHTRRCVVVVVGRGSRYVSFYRCDVVVVVVVVVVLFCAVGPHAAVGGVAVVGVGVACDVGCVGGEGVCVGGVAVWGVDVGVGVVVVWGVAVAGAVVGLFGCGLGAGGDGSGRRCSGAWLGVDGGVDVVVVAVAIAVVITRWQGRRICCFAVVGQVAWGWRGGEILSGSRHGVIGIIRWLVDALSGNTRGAVPRRARGITVVVGRVTSGAIPGGTRATVVVVHR